MGILRRFGSNMRAHFQQLLMVVLLFLAVTEALVLQTGARPCLHEVLARGTESMSGLVNGASCDVFYSRKLKKSDAELIREKGFLWKAAQDDAVARGVTPDKYLNDIEPQGRLSERCRKALPAKRVGSRDAIHPHEHFRRVLPVHRRQERRQVLPHQEDVP